MTSKQTYGVQTFISPGNSGNVLTFRSRAAIAGALDRIVEPVTARTFGAVDHAQLAQVLKAHLSLPSATIPYLFARVELDDS